MIPLLSLVPLVSNIIDRIFPDKAKADEARLKLAELEINGELKGMLGQMNINLEEAKNPRLWVSGWRPAVGWTCVIGIAVGIIGTVIFPFILAILPLLGYTDTAAIELASKQIQAIDTGMYVSLLMGMLGMGLRSYEKRKGIDTK